MDNRISNLRVNSIRLATDFTTLSNIGNSEDGGINRPALSHAHLAARSWFKKRVSDAGFAFHIDGAKNHSAILESKLKDAKTLLIGSHLDSVPNGGRFDSALGVVAALEVLRVIKEAELELPVHLEAIDFTDTEGFIFELLGSSALSGRLPTHQPDDSLGDEKEFLAKLHEAGILKDELLTAKRNPDQLAGFIELHIEQGTKLADSGHQIGIVSNIAGDCSYKFIYRGRAGMSASTPMRDRQDASIGASAFTLAISQLVMNNFPGCVVNVNNIQLFPGVIDMVPIKSEITFKFWAPDDSTLKRLENTIIQQGYAQADEYGLEFEIKLLSKQTPKSFSVEVQRAINHAAQTLALSHTPIISKANHDGQSLSHICPTGMIFIPSVIGISHSNQELTHWNDCINGANVLLQSVLRFVTLMMKDA